MKVEDYASDLQRTFYILEEGEEEAPAEVKRGFETIITSIEMAKEALKPGVQGVDIDGIAREYIVSQGYEEFPHGLGHQVGRFAHDGTALLGPAWEKYANKPFEPVEEGMVFTIEPRLMVPGRGVVTVEEMVYVTRDGADYLAEPSEGVDSDRLRRSPSTGRTYAGHTHRRQTVHRPGDSPDPEESR